MAVSGAKGALSQSCELGAEGRILRLVLYL